MASPSPTVYTGVCVWIVYLWLYHLNPTRDLNINFWQSWNAGRTPWCCHVDGRLRRWWLCRYLWRHISLIWPTISKVSPVSAFLSYSSYSPNRYPRFSLHPFLSFIWSPGDCTAFRFLTSHPSFPVFQLSGVVANDSNVLFRATNVPRGVIPPYYQSKHQSLQRNCTVQHGRRAGRWSRGRFGERWVSSIKSTVSNGAQSVKQHKSACEIWRERFLLSRRRISSSSEMYDI